MIKESERLKLALPSGEMQNDVLKLLDKIGVEYSMAFRRLVH